LTQATRSLEPLLVRGGRPSRRPCAERSPGLPVITRRTNSRFHWARPDGARTGYRDANTPPRLLRPPAAGWRMPVMIDAPDCGTSLDRSRLFSTRWPARASAMQFDRLHPLPQRYPHRLTQSWGGTDHTDAIDDAVALDLPLGWGKLPTAGDGGRATSGSTARPSTPHPPFGVPVPGLCLTKLLGRTSAAGRSGTGRMPSRNMAGMTTTGNLSSLSLTPDCATVMLTSV